MFRVKHILMDKAGDGGDAGAGGAGGTDAGAGQAGGERDHREDDEGVVRIHHSVLARIKREQREKGAREAGRGYDERARASGFDSFDDMFTSLANKLRDPEPDNKDGKGDKVDTKSDDKGGDNSDNAEIANKFKADAEKWRGKYEHSEQKRREVQRELASKEVEWALREIAVGKGCTDPRYAIHLLKEEMAGKSKEELEQLNEEEWFDKLKESSPHLFGEVHKPANTGTGGDAGDKKDDGAPGAGDATKQNADDDKLDVRKMSQREWQEYLARRGLANPANA